MIKFNKNNGGFVLKNSRRPLHPMTPGAFNQKTPVRVVFFVVVIITFVLPLLVIFEAL